MTDGDWVALRAGGRRRSWRRAYAPYSNFPVGAAGAGRRRPGRRRLQRRERLLRPRAVRRVRAGLRAPRHRRRPAGRAGLRRRRRAAAHAVRPVPAAAVGARRPGLPYRPRRRPAADVRAAALRLRTPTSAASSPRWLRRHRGSGRAGASGRAPGTVFVHPDVAGRPAGLDRLLGAFVRRADEEPAGILEEGPTWRTAAEGVAWGRARTPRVVVVDAQGGSQVGRDTARPAGIEQDWSTP